MKSTTPRILTLNGGSSSIKFALFEMSEPMRRILHGGIDRIGAAGTRLVVKGVKAQENLSRAVVAPDYATAADALKVRVIHTDEGIVIAKSVARLLDLSSDERGYLV